MNKIKKKKEINCTLSSASKALNKDLKFNLILFQVGQCIRGMVGLQKMGMTNAGIF